MSFGSGSTLFTSSALQHGETIGSVTLAVSNSGGAATAAAGSYTITPSAGHGGTFKASNYSITYDTGTLTVGQAQPQFSNLTASQTITYGTPSVVVSGTLAGVPAGESVIVNAGSVSSARTTATIDKYGNFTATLNTSGLSASTTTYAITYSYAGDQNFTNTSDSSTALTVNRATSTVSGITANNKVYDSTTSATLKTGSATLGGVNKGNTVTLSTSGASGTFASKDVANNITVTVSGLTISGDQAGDYTLTQPTTTANITAAKVLTV